MYNRSDDFKNFSKRGSDNFLNRLTDKHEKKKPLQSHNKRPMKTATKAVITCISLFLAVSLALSTFLFSTLNKINYLHRDNMGGTGVWEDLNGEDGIDDLGELGEVDISDSAIISDKKVQNILLIGSDSRGNNDTGRSDSMMLISIDRRYEKIKITSLMRDMYVAIPGKNSNRINAAFQYGGAKLLTETIEHNFKIKVDNVVILDFDSFTMLIDNIGGINVNLKSNQLKEMSKYGSKTYPKAGTYNLSGIDALTYVRMRSMDSDFQRTTRQRAVFELIFDKIRSYNVIELTAVATDMLPYITTDLSRGEILGFIAEASSLMDYEVCQFSLPAKGTWENKTIREMSVLVTDVNKCSEYLAKFIYTDDFDAETLE